MSKKVNETRDLLASIYSKVTNDAGVIGRMISTLTSATARIQELKRVTAASCVCHAVDHGDVTPMSHFVIACGEGERNDAIVKWACDKGPFTWVRDVVLVDGKQVKKNIFKYDNDKAKALKAIDRNELIKDLVDNPFWSYTPQKEVPLFDLIRSIHALVNTAKRKAQDENVKHNLTGLKELETLASMFKGSEHSTSKAA